MNPVGPSKKADLAVRIVQCIVRQCSEWLRWRRKVKTIEKGRPILVILMRTPKKIFVERMSLLSEGGSWMLSLGDSPARA